LAGAGYIDWPDHVGVVWHAGGAFVQFALTTCAFFTRSNASCPIVKMIAICFQIKACFKSIDLY
jgi:hypothetical protein